MKQIILLISIVIISYSCRAQNNAINSEEATINNINFLGNNESLVIQHFGEPISIEDYFFEMDNVMSQKYIYNGILFYIVNNIVDSFEIRRINYSFTGTNIRIGDDISTLQSIYPDSFRNKTNNILTIRFNNIDRFIVIIFNSNNQITLIRLGSY